MKARSITQEDTAELLRRITTSRLHAETVKTQENLIELAKSQAEAAEAYVLIDEINNAKKFFEHSLVTLEQIENSAVTADFCKRIGMVFYRAEKYCDASGYFSKAVKIYGTLSQDTPENRTELLKLYKICSESLNKTGRIDDAISLLSKSRDMMKRGYENSSALSDLLGWADALYALGGAYGHYEAYEASFKLYDEAMALYIRAERKYKSDTRRESANCLVSIGGVFELKKEYDRALENYEKALEINRRLAVRDGDELSLKHLMASCTHTAELCETMGRLVEALALFREKADVGIRLSKLKPAAEPPEILFLTPPENFAERLERLESNLPWYSLLFEMEEHPSQDEMYITYFTMGRLTEELARKTNDPSLWNEALYLFEASGKILSMIKDEFSENGLENKLREIKSCTRRIKSQINQGGNSDE